MVNLETTYKEVVLSTMNRVFLTSIFLLIFSLLNTAIWASDSDDAKDGKKEEYDPVGTVVEHIADANEFHIWKGVHMPLPCILYAPGSGWTFFMTNKLDHGHTAVDRYVLNHGRVNRIADDSFPMGEVHIEGVEHVEEHHTDENGEEVIEEVAYAVYHDQKYKLEHASKWDGGVLGGGVTSFYDFSITKVVFTMLLAAVLLCWVFFLVARGYKRNDGKAPKGIQSFIEPIFIFMRDEVTIPMIGEKHYERFQPFIMTLFFFILFCNLLGLIPFFPGSANVTGNIAITLVLAVFTFIVTNINGNKHYWEHIFWMPGIPAWVKLILTPVEVLSLIIKPFSLMIRLFANISAGHIIILSFVGLIFLFGNMGENFGGATIGVLLGGVFTAFMNLIELLVAFIQAFVFAILSASYIGAAVEDAHHGDEAHAH